VVAGTRDPRPLVKLRGDKCPRKSGRFHDVVCWWGGKRREGTPGAIRGVAGLILHLIKGTHIRVSTVSNRSKQRSM